MKNWQKDRNYRKYENSNGTFTYVITVDGEDVEVGTEVYLAYSGADRQERYCAERYAGRLLSLEGMDEDHVQLSYLTDEHMESAEDTAIMRILTEQAVEALVCLTEEEQRLIQAVVMGDVTEQEYADIVGVSQVAVHKRKNRLLKKIFKLMGY